MNNWLTLAALAAIMTTAAGTAAAQYSQPVDARSYNLGIIGGFAEVVHRGVKELGLSEVMEPEVMDDLIADAQVVAERNNVKLFRETDLIVTDLFPEDVAVGKHVLLIYMGDTLERYRRLKQDKEELVASGGYEGAAREEIARRFGRLLSYPESVLDEMLGTRPE